jgi:ketosteroid isomerase-like protein
MPNALCMPVGLPFEQGTTAGPIDSRVTLGFEKRGDAWRILHEHHSMPVTDDSMIGPDQAIGDQP